MTENELFKCYGQIPTPESAPEIRQTLKTQTEVERKSQGDGDQELIKRNCVLLFSLGDVADSIQIWDAKQCSFDMSCSIDVQLLCGAGLEETLAYLDGNDSDLATAASTYIRECIETGDFDGFTPTKWLDDYLRYFAG